MRRLLFIILCLCLAQAAFAQKRQNVYFLKNDGTHVDNKDSADFIRVISEPDSGSTLYNVQEFYRSNSQIKLIGKSSQAEYPRLEGLAVEYYRNGKRKFTGNYTGGGLNGQAFRYYPNGAVYAELDYGFRRADIGTDEEKIVGYYRVISAFDSIGHALVTDGNGIFPDYENDNFKKPHEQGRIKHGFRDSVWTGEDIHFKIRFAENYTEGKLISGIGTDSTGVQHSYSGAREMLPQYVGGFNALYTYIGKNLVYPDSAFKNNIQGRVIVTFTVRKNGRIENVRVLKPGQQLLDDEAKRVLRKSPMWKPGSYCGVPEDVVYSIPISFSLKG